MDEHAMRLGNVVKPVELPWIYEEEVFAEHHVAQRYLPSIDPLRKVVALAALASFAVPLECALKAATASPFESKVEKHFV